MLRRAALMTATALFLGVNLVPGHAQGGDEPVVCTYDPATHTMKVVRERAWLAGFGVGANGTEIHVRQKQCGPDDAITEVDTIRIIDKTPFGVGVSVGLLQPLGPGAENEPGISDEIELEFDLGAGSDMIEFYTYAETGAHISAGTKSVGGHKQRLVNLNANEVDGIDPDMTLKGVDFINMVVSEGVGSFKGDGGRGTGGPIDIRLSLRGGNSSDTLFGGRAKDMIYGGRGACNACTLDDIIDGGAGADDITGNLGPDDIGGGEGPDHIAGHFGDDVIRGGRGKDDLNGNPGSDTLYGMKGDDVLDGGDDDDACDGGSGDDELDNCEQRPLSPPSLIRR